MEQQSTATIPANGATTPHDLFVLTDEQILEIEPEEVTVAPRFSAASSPAAPSPESAQQHVIPSGARDRGNTFAPAISQNVRQESSVAALPPNDGIEQGATNA